MSDPPTIDLEYLWNCLEDPAFTMPRPSAAALCRAMVLAAASLADSADASVEAQDPDMYMIGAVRAQIKALALLASAPPTDNASAGPTDNASAGRQSEVICAAPAPAYPEGAQAP